jgi:ABC-type nickel/cobalt efflux system permease component RcnA
MGPACETEPTGDSRDTAEGLPRAEAGAPALLRVPGLRRAVAFLALLTCLAATSARAHDIPNQRVDRSIQVTLRPSRLEIDYEVSLSELTLTQDLRSLIGSLPGGDRRDWLDRFARETGPLNARGYFVAVDKEPVEVEFLGFDLIVEEHPRYTFHLAAALPPAGRLEIYDTNYATSEGTSRLAIRGVDGVRVSGDSLPAEVSEIPARPVWELTDEEELRSKRVVVNYTAMIPDVVREPASRPAGAPPARAEGRESGARTGPRLGVRLGDFLDRNRGTSVPVALLIAAMLGAAHSLQPGHGKSLVSAVALRRDARWYHPMVLGIVASVTHTGSVLIIAAAIWITGTARLEGLHVVLVRSAGFAIGAAGAWRLGRFLGGHGEHSEQSVRPRPDAPGTLELVGLGVSGGLVPCWDAVGLIVLAAALGRLTLGALCVAAFGAGMAAVLVTVGFLASRVWSTWLAASASPSLERRIGVATSAVLVTVGLTLFFQ